MKRLRFLASGILLLVCAVSAAGCYRITYRTRRAPEPGQTQEHVQHLSYFGFRKNDYPVNIEGFCPAGVSEVRSVQTFWDGLARLFFVWQLHSEMVCAKPPPAADEAVGATPAASR